MQLLQSLFPSLSCIQHNHHLIHPCQYHPPPSIGNYYAPEYSSTSELGHQQQPLPKQVYQAKQTPTEEMEIEEESPSFQSLLNPSSTYCLVIPQVISTLNQASNGFDIIMTTKVATAIWNRLIHYHCLAVYILSIDNLSS